MEIQPLHADFGARITGLDLSVPLDEARRGALLDAIDRWSFLCFPDQAPGDERHLAFTREIGEPEPNHLPKGEEGRIDYFGTIGNVQEDGTALGNDHRKTIFLTGNNMWHTDASFKPVPAFISINAVYEVPSEGGETQFVSARAAYDRLDDARRAEVDPLIAVHDYVFSRSKVSPDAVSPALAKSLPPVRQRFVRRNPSNGRKNLFMGSHAREIEGWSKQDSRDLIDGLIEEATAEANILTHRWQAGELVIWDNRCLLHRGLGYDADRHRRLMRQTRVRGAGPTLEEAF
ncbi:MAG: TauD/TfdA family dioxygenase [Minwuia sp.]|nr:TauD/TfdA family dioxygenase [Minwuia sp.]